MSERYSIADLREAATRTSPPLLLTDQAKLLALVTAVEAARDAAILTYDPRKTTAQNDEYQRRARRLNQALARFDFEAENGHPGSQT